MVGHLNMKVLHDYRGENRLTYPSLNILLSLNENLKALCGLIETGGQA